MSAEGARGKLPPTSIFSSSCLWESWKKFACVPTQAVLAITSNQKNLILAFYRKRRNFFEEHTHRQVVTLSTINIRTAVKGDEKSAGQRISAAEGN